jgi:ATP-dependent Lon protease
LGTTDEESFFLNLQDSRKLPPALGRVLGGALRKVRLESVRAPKKEIERLLLPPKTEDRRVKQIVEKLEDIRLAAPSSVPNEEEERLRLRKQMLAIDADYLKSYIEWLNRLPALEKGLENKNSY